MSAFHIPFLPPEALGDEAAIRAAAARAIALAKGGESRAALALALQARRNAQVLALEAGEGEALNAAALVHLIRGDPVAAVATAIDACQLARRTGQGEQHAQALVTLFMAGCMLGACEDAPARLLACAEEAARERWHAVEVRARLSMGVILGDQGRFDAAARQYARALEVSRAHPEGTSPSRVVANVANLHRKRAVAAFAGGYEAQALHECNEAVRLAEEACRLAREEGTVATEIDAVAILGCIHDLRGDREPARACLRESIALGQWARCPPAILWVLCKLGQICLDLEEPDGAAAAFREALRIAEELRPSRKIAEACRGLAAVAACRGDPAEAARWRARAADEAASFGEAGAKTRRQLEEFLAFSR